MMPKPRAIKIRCREMGMESSFLFLFHMSRETGIAVFSPGGEFDSAGNFFRLANEILGVLLISVKSSPPPGLPLSCCWD